jgi:hypothetical protein
MRDKTTEDRHRDKCETIEMESLVLRYVLELEFKNVQSIGVPTIPYF